ncbi:MAG: glycosyl hydrolase [Reichenbachiella sp.]
MSSTKINWNARFLFLLTFLIFSNYSYAQFTPVGSGSYTTVFPGVDAANRNSYPSGAPQLSGAAVGKPVPTNDWWSSVIKSDHVNNLFNYPMALKTTNPGLVLSYIPWGVYDDQEPIIVGVTGLNATKATVSDYSDWTVTINWNDGSHDMHVTSGIAMPFLYYQKQASDVVEIKVNLGTATIVNEMLIVENARNDADFVVYAPVGSTWSQNGNVYTSNLNGNDYWSTVMLPITTSNVTATATEYKKYAYVFPANTTSSWSFDEASSVMRTDFVVETDVKEGVETNVLLGLLPHQWANLATDSPQPDQGTFQSIRGEVKTLDGNTFSVENTYHGILPTLPYLNNYSDGFSIVSLNEKIRQLENDGLSSWTDSYNEGQMMNRLIQTARIADLSGNTDSRDKMVATVKERLEDWLKAEASEVAFLFYYNDTWSAMLGYPAGHGQDNNINDHHFHWGYFIHAASFLEQFEPGWASEWGDMVNLLIQDAASSNREDTKFPYLRNFSPYAGHCWANGFATFPQGNDQESTSESMQFNSSLIHWGTMTGNDEIRDLGIYLYTTEQTAIEEYWLDVNERNFKPSQEYSLVSRIWGNSYDNGTFWTSDIAASYGIELYPIHGGSLYLGHNLSYVEKLWGEIEENTGILTNQANDNLWHDVMWEYLAFIDPAKAIELYDSYPERSLKFGVSDAQTYYWLHAMNAMGNVDTSITADYPIAVAFNKDGETTYTAHNYSNAPITVAFSDGFNLEVPENSMATNKDINIESALSSSFDQAYTNGSVDLSLSTASTEITKVEFYDGETLIGEILNAPFNQTASNLNAGIHDFYTKNYAGEIFDVSNIVTVIVGLQKPFTEVFPIPGIIEAAHYDQFEGGKGQGVSYHDVSANNEGKYRPEEYVDATLDNTEGATIGWISGGEWLEYSIDVENSGLHDFMFRYASGNSNGGGPFHLELNGEVISDDIFVDYTSDWDEWASKTVNNIPLTKGQNILKLAFTSGEMNIGRMTFAYAEELPYDQPIADAGGDNIVVIVPETTTTLDGTGSTNSGVETLTYQWTQVYGPSAMVFSDDAIVNPDISSLEEGIYEVQLTVSNGSYSDTDEIYVIVNDGEEISPTVSIQSPGNNEEYIAGKVVNMSVAVSDLDGAVVGVEYFANDVSIGISEISPFTLDWTSEVGEYSLVAVATDNDGNSSSSQPITLILTEAPSCSGTSANGDYEYTFSDDSNNPTLTFIPSTTSIGSPTCILYYGTNANGGFAGQNATPNAPYHLSASEGSTIYFYYTYSHPEGGERNTSQDLDSYVIGSCLSAGGGAGTLTIADGILSIDENSSVGTVVGTPTIFYSESDALNYSIVSGNESSAFQINSESGELSVVNQSALDFETASSFTLNILVTDGTLEATGSITINLNDINEDVLNSADLPILREISFYPNPVSGTLSVKLPNAASTVTIYGMDGKIMKHFKQDNTQLKIDMTLFMSGIYIMEVRLKEGAKRYKISKH